MFNFVEAGRQRGCVWSWDTFLRKQLKACGGDPPSARDRCLGTSPLDRHPATGQLAYLWQEGLLPLRGLREGSLVPKASGPPSSLAAHGRRNTPVWPPENPDRSLQVTGSSPRNVTSQAGLETQRRPLPVTGPWLPEGVRAPE